MKAIKSALDDNGQLRACEVEINCQFSAYLLVEQFWKKNVAAVSLHSVIYQDDKFLFTVKSKHKIIFQIKSV